MQKEAKRTRVRGFAPWQPRSDTQHLLGQVQGVLTEYAAYLPLTLRQIYYRLVGAHGYDKTLQGYTRLSETLTRARRARLISMDVIRDDGGSRVEPEFWQDADDFLSQVRERAKCFTLDRSQGQPVRLVLMCEAAGMVPQLASVAEPYGVPVFSSGGFESVTEKHRFARNIAPTVGVNEVLHIGDHDPSGIHLFRALQQDVEAFVTEYGGSVTFTRLAVTPEQMRQLKLPTAPAKATDRRSFKGRTTQAEAIPPDLLLEIVREAIELRLDVKAYDAVLRRELKVRRELQDRLG